MSDTVNYLGEHFFTADGLKEFVVVEYNKYNDVVIEFVESKYRKHTSMDSIKKGLQNPFAKSAVVFDDPRMEILGNIYKTNSGYFIQVINADSRKSVVYKFLDEYGYIGSTTIQNIRKGEVKNPFERNKFGGYLGVGIYSNGNFPYFKDLYNIWHNMIVRGTSSRYMYKESFGDTQLYRNCMVCEDWMCFNTFVDWYVKEMFNLNTNYQYELDKDLYYPLYKSYTNGYKLYSPKTVCLIPHELNLLIFDNGRWNNPKNVDTILELAEKYYSDKALTDKTYNAIQCIYGNKKNHYINLNINKDYIKNAVSNA